MKISAIIPMNLQLFASSEGVESSVNADPVVNVEPQTNEQVETDNNVSSEVVDTQSDNKPVQSAEDNARFANIRREAEAKAREEAQKLIDAEYSKLYGEQYGIHSKAEYDKAVQEYEEQQRLQAEAERTGASPELLKEIEDLKAFKNETLAERQKREDEAFQQKIKNDVNQVLETAKKEGFDITEEQLLQAAVENNISDMKKVYKLIKPDLDMETIKQNAVKEYIEAKRQGKIPVEGGGTTPVVASETPKDFNQAKEGALAMLKASKLFNN